MFKEVLGAIFCIVCPRFMTSYMVTLVIDDFFTFCFLLVDFKIMRKNYFYSTTISQVVFLLMRNHSGLINTNLSKFPIRFFFMLHSVAMKQIDEN